MMVSPSHGVGKQLSARSVNRCGRCQHHNTQSSSCITRKGLHLWMHELAAWHAFLIWYSWGCLIDCLRLGR